MKKKKLTKEQQKKLQAAYKKYLAAVETAEAEHREKQIRLKMEWEKNQFLYGK